MHEGHKLLLKTAICHSEKIVIAITVDEILSKKKYREYLEDFDTRKSSVINYINSLQCEREVDFEELKDKYGTAIINPDYEAIIVSQETYLNAIKINEIRQQKGFDPLVIVVIPLIKDRYQNRISSTHIRQKISDQ